MNRPLDKSEIEEILNPPRKGAYIITSTGQKIFTGTKHLPDYIVGSFQGKKGQPRKYIQGVIDAYKEGKE